MMSHESLLAKKTVDNILATARENKEQDGEVYPTLFLNVGQQKLLIVPVQLPDGTESRKTYFRNLGRTLHRRGICPLEVLFVTEGWVVSVQKTPAAYKFAPSEHPARQEALVIVGRDAGGARATNVIQPMLSADGKAPVWQPLEVENYNTPVDKGPRPVGLLDELFAGLAEG